MSWIVKGYKSMGVSGAHTMGDTRVVLTRDVTSQRQIPAVVREAIKLGAVEIMLVKKRNERVTDEG